jgi:uncharacterized membrane-anchored protein
MKSRSVLWVVFAATCAAQLAFARGSLWRGETTLRSGAVYRFLTAPVDPVDPFRGRYVRLAFQPALVPVAGGAELSAGDTAYVELGVDEEGFGELVRAHGSPPAADHLALAVHGASESLVTVQLPFERFYAEEGRAMQIDRERWRAGGRFAVTVRVKDGHGVVESLALGEAPVPFTLDDVLRPDPSRPLPAGLAAALVERMSPNEARACRENGCLLFEVDLDPEIEHEFVLRYGNASMYYWREDPRGFIRLGILQPRGRVGTPSIDSLLEGLRASGARAVNPPLPDLRIGELSWEVRS